MRSIRRPLTVKRRSKWLTEGIPGLKEVKPENNQEIGVVKQFDVGQRVWKGDSKYDGKGFAPVFPPTWTGSLLFIQFGATTCTS